jgi:hypothetical protein
MDACKEAIAQAEPGSTVFMCRGNWNACAQALRKHDRLNRRGACRWCAEVEITETTTPADLMAAMKLDA